MKKTNMAVPACPYGMWDQNPMTPEESFRSRANLQEGVSGSAPIDTTFENTERHEVVSPRSKNRPQSVSNYDGDLSQDRGEWK